MKKMLFAAALITASLGINANLEASSFTYHSQESINYTTEYWDMYYPMTTRERLEIPEGSYTGIKIEYLVSHTEADTKLKDLPSDFFLVGFQPEVGQGTFIQHIGAQMSNNVLVGKGTKVVSIDQPLYFYRSFNNAPEVYNGGDVLGLRHKNYGGVETTGEWKNVKLEFYEAEITSFEGDVYSGGTWQRPQVNQATGDDYGRADQYTPYSVITFTVEEDGVYGIHTQIKQTTGNPVNNDGQIYLFEGDAAIIGDYSNLMFNNGQGLWGGGHLDIDSVELKKDRTYSMVLTTRRDGGYYNHKTWIGGPGRVNEK